jgi:hypothetical protein
LPGLQSPDVVQRQLAKLILNILVDSDAAGTVTAKM